MKVLFVSNDPSIFDPQSAARARMRTYAKAIGELHIVSMGKPGTKDEQDGELMLHPIHAWKIFRVRALASRAREIIEAHAIEVVSAQDPFEHGLAALRATKGTKAKLHIQVHTDFLSPWFLRSGNWRSPEVRMPAMNRVRLKIADKVIPYAGGIRVVSERVKASLMQKYDRIPEPTVIPVPVPITPPPKVLLPPNKFSFALIAVGRLEPEKRIEDIIAALARLSLTYPSVGLFIVGEGSEKKKLHAMAEKLGLGEKVVFLGERPDAWGLMQSAHVLVQASAYEGYGRTLLEAALAKVPIVTSDVGIVGEVFKGYEHVLATPVADPTNIAFHIGGLIEDTVVRMQLPIAAEEAARAHLAAQGDLVARMVEDLSRTRVVVL